MYEIGKKYAIFLKKKFTYTGVVLEEDSISIRMHTIRDEEVILYKSEIESSLLKTEENEEKSVI